MPSTTSSSVSTLLASSTVMTPSLPTFSIARAIISPISGSALAESEPTCATSAEVEILRVFFSSSDTTTATALSMPRFRSIGFMPAATDFAPSRTMAWASTVAVVVPSPATSLVLLATSRTIWAPMFSNLSASSISFATVTPSLVTRGAPKLLSSTTLRPFGPSVTFTASARMSTPRSIRSRAPAPNLTSLAAMKRYLVSLLVGGVFSEARKRPLGSGGLLLRGGALEDAHDVGLLHDQELLVVELDLGARPLAEQDAVAGLDVERAQLALVVQRAGADRDHLALLRLLLGGVGDDDAARRLLLRRDPADENAVVQGTEIHAAFL